MLNVGYVSFGDRLNCLNCIAVESSFSRNLITCLAVMYVAKMQHASVNVTTVHSFTNFESALPFKERRIFEVKTCVRMKMRSLTIYIHTICIYIFTFIHEKQKYSMKTGPNDMYMAVFRMFFED